MPDTAPRRIAEIRRRAKKRGPILLRCPYCRHYLTGIISSRGEHKFKDGERGNLYCTARGRIVIATVVELE